VALVDAAMLAPLVLIPDPLSGASLQDLAFSPCGNLLALCGVSTFANRPDDGGVAVIDLVTGKSLYHFAQGVWRLVWHPFKKMLVLAGPEGTLGLWDPETGHWQKHEHTAESALHVLGFSQGGSHWVASAGNDELWVYELGRTKPVGTLSLPARVVAVAPGEADGELAVLMAGGDGWSIHLPSWLADKLA
jgi:WD40 repeat protein